MDRINHVKIVTPDPAAIDRFLREVVDVPAGWSLAPAEDAPHAAEVLSPARDADGNFTAESVHAFRGASSFGGGYITGSTESRQFQILQGITPTSGRSPSVRATSSAPTSGASTAVSRAPNRR